MIISDSGKERRAKGVIPRNGYLVASRPHRQQRDSSLRLGMTHGAQRALHHNIDQSPWYVDHLARFAAGEGLGDLGWTSISPCLELFIPWRPAARDPRVAAAEGNADHAGIVSVSVELC